MKSIGNPRLHLPNSKHHAFRLVHWNIEVMRSTNWRKTEERTRLFRKYCNTVYELSFVFLPKILLKLSFSQYLGLMWSKIEEPMQN